MVWFLFGSKNEILFNHNRFGNLDEHKISEKFTSVSDKLVKKENFIVVDGTKEIELQQKFVRRKFNQIISIDKIQSLKNKYSRRFSS